MTPVLTHIFLLFFFLYAVSISSYTATLRRRRSPAKLKEIIYYSIAGLYLLIIAFVTALPWGMEWHELGAFWLITLLTNPLVILFYFSDIQSRLLPKVRKWLSLTALTVYSGFLYFGLWNLNAPAGNWGNSTQVTGAFTILWSLSNILLASLMNTARRFAGILRLVTATASFVTILLTHTTNHHSDETEQMYHWISLLLCVYLLFEAFLFLSLPRQKNNTPTPLQSDNGLPKCPNR